MAKRGKIKKRRTRTQHPGVKLLALKRAGGTTIHVARYVDPDSGKHVQKSLAALGLTTDAARRAWAISKAKSITERRAAIAAGDVIHQRTTVDDAIEEYFKGALAEGLKDSTLHAYREGTNPFSDWCRRNKVAITENLTGPKLEAYRKTFVARKAMVPGTGKGVGRGSYAPGNRRRSPTQVNKCLRGLRTVLNQWRREGLVPLLDSDAIRDSLRFMKVSRDAPHFLRATEIKALVKAALRHDQATYSFVRRGESHNGIEYSYAPIFEFVVATLLTGCRFAELAGLRWSEVDFENREIHLRSDRTKTGQGRKIPLDVSPILTSVLEGMKLKRGAEEFVFGGAAGMRRDTAERERKRLIGNFAAPKFTWHDLRRTCGTFLACAPGIYSGAGAFHAAKRLGHSVVVSERHYAGAINNIPKGAETLEAAMGIQSLLSDTLPKGRQLSARKT